MDSETKTKVRVILEKAMDGVVSELNSADLDVGYYPDDCGAMVDAALAVLEHQSRIDEYHKKNGTAFN